MASVIGRMTGVSISSDYFTETTLLEFFPKHKNRAALVYGRNGSGKSMIAQGFREYKDLVNPRTVTLELTDGASSIGSAPEDNPGKIFIFDEEYISNRVQVKDSGLDAIVLFGEQVSLNEQIERVQGQINSLEITISEQQTKREQFSDKNNVNSPDYWISQIQEKLREPNGWAEIGSKIKQHKHNLSVTNDEIEEIGSLTPTEPRKDLLGKRDILLAQYFAAATSSTLITARVPNITIIGDINEKAVELLKKVVKKPQLTNREAQLLQLFGVKAAQNARSFVSNKENNICDKCFQPISDEYRASVINEIESILNRAVEEFKDELEELQIPELLIDTYEIYRGLPSYERVRNQLDDYNKVIKSHDSVIKDKIDHPFEPIEYEDSADIMAACEAMKQALDTLEEDRMNYNRTITERSSVQKDLLELNYAIAHYGIKDMYASLKKQRTAKQGADERLRQLKNALEELTGEKIKLDSQRKSFSIAVGEINRALDYIFFNQKRLSLELEADQLYHLRVNGNKVKPNKISCGERNALALCYFFTEISKDMDAEALYSDETLLVIDDPVSSFDIENRIGIISFLRWKLEQVLSSCATTKIMVMTHDISVLFDLEKAMQEISQHCKRESISADYELFQLDNKRLCGFSYKKYNEYTQLLGKIYQYATSADEDHDSDLVIGNMMRRVLEAFSTFSFRLGIDSVSQDKRVLDLLSDEESMYYRNLMYRLVLNMESHFEMNIQGAPEMSFFTFLSPSEKKRTAKDILCFIYCLNKAHIISHLPNAEPKLRTWCSNISRCQADL